MAAPVKAERQDFIPLAKNFINLRRISEYEFEPELRDLLVEKAELCICIRMMYSDIQEGCQN